MYNEISVFGKTCHRNQQFRLAFDRNMERIDSENGAAFVLEITLLTDGKVILRQAGASAERTGLVLSTSREQVNIRTGAVVDLSGLLRFQQGEIYHPARPNKLVFLSKGYADRGSVLQLKWQGSAVPVPQSPAADKNTRVPNFIPARKFNELAGNGMRVELHSGLWFPMFDNEEDAAEFGRYVSGYPRRVMPYAKFVSSARWSPRGGYVAEIFCEFPGWGTEKGAVVCGDNQVAGLAVVQGERWVLLPLKSYTHALRTVSGSLYLLFTDGTAFCRSKSTGPQAAADVLYFCSSERRALEVFERGGELEVTTLPANGFVPIYITGPKRAVGNKLRLEARSFRLGTQLVM